MKGKVTQFLFRMPDPAAIVCKFFDDDKRGPFWGNCGSRFVYV